MAQAPAPKCNICKEDIAKVFCYECHHFLCQSCNSWHEKFPATKRHTVTDSQCVDRSTLMLTLVCEDHDLEFAYYCRDCECLICDQCVTSVHKGHSFTDIAEVAATARGDIKNRLEQIKDNIKNLSDLIDDFKTTKQTKLEIGTDNFITEINVVSKDLVRIIETETQTNLTDASDFLVQEKQQLLCNLAKLEKSYSEYYSIHEKLEQILREKHDVSFFLNQISLIKEFESLDDISTPEEPKETKPFKTDSFVDSVIERIASKYNSSELITKDKLVVVAIQIGRDKSGCAFQLCSEFRNDTIKTSSSKFASGIFSPNLKLPNSVLLDPDQTFVAFGYDAENKYHDLVVRQNHHDWYYFNEFTKNIPVLDGEKDIRNFNVKTYDLHKDISALVLFHMLIKFNVDQASCRMNPFDFYTTNIQWVLAIPESWNTSSMRKLFCTAFKKAGIDDLIIASETEASALFCKYVLKEKDTDDQEQNTFCDVLDVAAYHVQHDYTVKELSKASIGAWGSTNVDEGFKQTLIRLVGMPIYLHFCEQNPEGVIDLYREFQCKKLRFSGRGENFTFIKMPASFRETVENETGETFSEVIYQSALSRQVKWCADKLRINSYRFASFFYEAKTNLIGYIKTILKDSAVVGTTIIIMVGEFSECPLIQRIVKEEFPDMQVLIPEHPQLSVLKGAVIIGHFH
ncbi:unnamed protein product [Mytilus coruscus]|uniref:B box-type domain-containing protein n=1 Tax=Mytilus coruscus TaxID=42192 RepID=A0A6J8DCM6_MYTCO|nr:unnamed protein product [Mytilus coruscus]